MSRPGRFTVFAALAITAAAMIFGLPVVIASGAKVTLAESAKHYWKFNQPELSPQTLIYRQVGDFEYIRISRNVEVRIHHTQRDPDAPTYRRAMCEVKFVTTPTNAVESNSMVLLEPECTFLIKDLLTVWLIGDSTSAPTGWSK